MNTQTSGFCIFSSECKFIYDCPLLVADRIDWQKKSRQGVSWETKISWLLLLFVSEFKQKDLSRECTYLFRIRSKTGWGNTDKSTVVQYL